MEAKHAATQLVGQQRNLECNKISGRSAMAMAQTQGEDLRGHETMTTEACRCMHADQYRGLS
jgi:hypothetical protein